MSHRPRSFRASQISHLGPVVYSLISRDLGESRPAGGLSPSDSPELGLLELVAARDVLENVVQLQGARRTFTTHPLLNRDVFSEQMLPANTRAPWPPPVPPTSPCHATQRPPHGFSPGCGKRLRTEAKQELQTTCPEANLKSHQRDAFIILTIMILKCVLSFRKRKNCFFLSRAVWVCREEGVLSLPQCCRHPLSVAVPQSHPKPPSCPGSYVLLHFLAQLLTLPGVWLHQVLREKPGQPQRQPVGNWKEKFPSQTPSFLVREITQPKAGSMGTRMMLGVQILYH